MRPARKVTKSGAIVYSGSAHVERADAAASLPAKLERILNKVDLEHLCQGAWVPIKMHLGGDLFQQIHGKDPWGQLQALERQGVGRSRHKLIEVV